jgi:hypothetical protein
VRNIDVGKQRPDVLREANWHRPTPISVSSDTGSHSLDWSVSAEVPLAAGLQDQRWTLARIRDLVAARFGGGLHHLGDLAPAAPLRLDLPDRRAPGHRA